MNNVDELRGLIASTLRVLKQLDDLSHVHGSKVDVFLHKETLPHTVFLFEDSNRAIFFPYLITSASHFSPAISLMPSPTNPDYCLYNKINLDIHEIKDKIPKQTYI